MKRTFHEFCLQTLRRYELLDFIAFTSGIPLETRDYRLLNWLRRRYWRLQ